MGNEAEQLHNSKPSNSTSPGANGSRFATLLERVKLVLLKPNDAWDQIARESTTVQALFQNYIVPLALIPPVCELLRMWLIGQEVPFVGTFRWSFFGGLTTSAIAFVMSLVAIYIIAAVIRFVATKQQVSVTHERSFQLIAYSMTPVYVGGLLRLIPGLSMLGVLLGVYGLYLFYLGIPKMTSTPTERRMPFFALSLVGSFVVLFLVSFIVMRVAPQSMAPTTLNFDKVQLPGGGGSIDVNQLQKAAEEFQKALPRGQ